MKKAFAILIAVLMLFSLFQGALRENVVKAGSQPIWPMVGYNAQRTGQCPYDSSKNNGTLKWKYAMSNPGSPVIASDGTIYTVSNNHLYAFDPYGLLKWKSIITVLTSPAIAIDGTIYAGGSNPYGLYALYTDGTQKWRFETASSIISSPAIAPDGTIYVGSSDGYLYAINLDGSLKWKYDCKAAYIAVAPNGTIYATTGSPEGSTYLSAINPDGTLKWKIEKNKYYPVVSSSGVIYAASSDYYLCAINPEGSIKWKYKSTFSISSYPSISTDGTIYFGAYNTLYALDSKGSLKWTYTIIDKYNSIILPPVIGKEGTIYFCTKYIYALNPNGALKWKYETSSSNSSSPIAISSDGSIYVALSNALYSLGSAVNTSISPPRNLVASVTSNSSILLTWAPSKAGSRPIAGYAIYRGTSSGGESPTPIATVSANINTYIDTNVTIGIAYYYYVKVFDNQSPPKYSELSNEVSAIISPHIWPAGSGYDNQRTGQCPYSTSMNNGTLKWKFEIQPNYNYDYLGSYSRSFPAIALDGTIYISGGSYIPNKNYLLALSKENIVKWKFETNGRFDSYPVIAVDGTIYAGTTNGYLYAINPDGTLKWRFETGKGIDFIVLGTDGTIYAQAGNSSLFSFNPDGNLKNKIELHYGVLPVIGSDGTIYAGSLYAFNPNGTVKWEMSISTESITLAPDGTIYAYSSSTLYSLDPYADNPDYRIKWKYTADKTITTPPVVAYDGTVYIVTYDGYLYAFNSKGLLKWKNQYKITNNKIDWTPTISSEGTLFVGIGKTLYAINPDGTVKWNYEDKDITNNYDSFSSSPVISNDGTVYIVNKNEGLYAIGGTSSISIKSSVSRVEGSYPQGSISPSGIMTINPGESITYHISPDEGSIISTVKVDGVSVGAVSSYTFKNVTANHTIEAVFDEQKTYTIQVSAGIGGSISPSGTITLNSGESKTFTITPNSGYKVSVVKVDGVSKGSISSYTFTNIISNHTIEATFEKEITQTVIILKIGNTTFTINGVQNTLDSPPVIKNNRTLLPIRAIIEALGGTVSWDANEKKVTVALDSTTIELWIGKNTAKVNGIDTPIDATNSKVIPEIINSRTMLPLRFVTENLGCDVQWDGTTKTITIIYKL